MFAVLGAIANNPDDIMIAWITKRKCDNGI
jgi:hypothetical protein